MRDAHQIVDVSVSTTSTRPLCGMVDNESADSNITFELTEETALSICTEIERFLTQKQYPKPKVRLSQ
jgi:hypothetical protein